MDKKLIIAVVVILLVLFWFKDDITNRFSNDTSGRKRNKRNKVKEEPERGDFHELFELLHNEMINDIQLDDFQTLSGLDAIAFIDLKQLYTDHKESGADLNSITEEDYEEVLGN